MISSLKELCQFIIAFNGKERALNRELLAKVKNGDLSERLFLDYLELTQGEIISDIEFLLQCPDIVFIQGDQT